MIYNNNIKLTGNEADRFLESCDVAIYDDCITIDECEYSYESAQNILNENGISLYDDCVVLEGEQAEEYKKRKADEKRAAEKKENDRDKHRYDEDRKHNIGCGSRQNPAFTPERDDYLKVCTREFRRRMDSTDKGYNNLIKHIDDGKYDKYDEPDFDKTSRRDANIAIDATNRHMRRHPKQYGESASIFSDTNII